MKEIRKGKCKEGGNRGEEEERKEGERKRGRHYEIDRFEEKRERGREGVRRNRGREKAVNIIGKR